METGARGLVELRCGVAASGGQERATHYGSGSSDGAWRLGGAIVLWVFARGLSVRSGGSSVTGAFAPER